MQNSGLIEFGSHTLSHVNLSTITDEQLLNELKKSKEEVENIIKKVLPADLEVLFLWVELNVHQYVEVMHFIWEITQFFVLFIF